MLFNVSTFRHGVTSYLHTDQPVQWTRNGRLSTQITSYFPAGTTIHYKPDEREWTEGEGEGEEDDEEDGE